MPRTEKRTLPTKRQNKKRTFGECTGPSIGGSSRLRAQASPARFVRRSLPAPPRCAPERALFVGVPNGPACRDIRAVSASGSLHEIAPSFAARLSLEPPSLPSPPTFL